MRIILILLIPLIVACGAIRPVPAAAASGEPSGMNIAGQWRGTWSGTGIFLSSRNDAVTMDLVQRDDRALGRLVLEGTTAAESVPAVVRFQGLNGIRIVGEIHEGTVTLRHHLDGRLFTADLKVAESGDQMFGFVRGTWPAVRLLLTRVEPKLPAPAPGQAPAAPPAKTESRQEPEPPKDTAVALAPAPRSEPEELPKPADRVPREEFVAVQDLPAVHFEFDKATIRSDAADALAGYAGWLKDHGDTVLLIEGHCDERGTPEYNVALGDRRAKAVKDYLLTYGVAADRLSTVSFGKERPACSASTEACHEENRRAEFRVKSR
jgi:peptidoglycan-associated lipoprotein